MDLITKIKDIAHKVSEGYLIFGSPINEQLYSLHQSGEIGNSEILKRICELVNQNVYLSLFHDKSIDNSNISFNYADYDTIKKEISDTEADMEAYDLPIDDFRGGLYTESQGSPVYEEKTASLHELVAVRDSVDHFINTFQTIRADAIKTAEDSYIQMKLSAKSMCYNGDSIDDMCKIASDYTNAVGLDHIKVASAYRLIEDELKESNQIVRKGLTKIAEMPINGDDEFFEPIEKFATSLGVINSSEEIIKNAKDLKCAIDGAIYGHGKSI